jgi:hypothetical protein
VVFTSNAWNWKDSSNGLYNPHFDLDLSKSYVHTLKNLVKSSEIKILQMKHLNVVEVQAKGWFMNDYILNLCLIK